MFRILSHLVMAKAMKAVKAMKAMKPMKAMKTGTGVRLTTDGARHIMWMIEDYGCERSGTRARRLLAGLQVMESGSARIAQRRPPRSSPRCGRW